MKAIKQALLKGERALFKSNELRVENSVFADGESPLKESSNIEIVESIFKWKYPLWYCSHVKVDNSTLLETARSGIWYTNHIEIKNSTIDAPKTFRRGKDIILENVHMVNATETLWNCSDIQLRKVSVKGDYFGMNSEHIYVDDFNLTGNYCFDGAKNVEVHNAKLNSKDAFWNCENVVVYDSIIVGEYLGWNSKNITFINCTIESLQGLCYIENLKMIECKLINTTLAFEYSTVDVSITSHIDSVINPISGVIRATSIGKLTIDKEQVDPSQTDIMLKHCLLKEPNVEMASCIC